MPSKEVLEVAANRAIELMPEYNPQNIANTLWSFATLGKYPTPHLLDVAATRAVQLMPVITNLEIETAVTGRRTATYAVPS